MYDSGKATPVQDGPTHELLDRNIYNLFKSISRFEDALDTFEGGSSSLKEKTAEEKIKANVVAVYKNAPSQIANATERIHMLVDRLQNQFS